MPSFFYFFVVMGTLEQLTAEAIVRYYPRTMGLIELDGADVGYKSRTMELIELNGGNVRYKSRTMELIELNGGDVRYKSRTNGADRAG